VAGQRFFACERADDVLVVSPLEDVGAADQDAVQADVAQLLSMLADADARHVVFDFYSVSYFGSAMLEAILAVWREVRSRGGRLAVCNLSDTERELLATVKFDSIWPIGATREEAMALVQRRKSR